MNKRVLDRVAGIVLANLGCLLFATNTGAVSNIPERKINYSNFKISANNLAVSQTTKNSSSSFKRAQFFIPTKVNLAQLPVEELLEGIEQNQKTPPELQPENLAPQPLPNPEPETELELTPEQEQQQKRIILEAVITDALNQTSKKYPWLVNTSDKLIINPRIHNPAAADTVINLDWSLDNSTSLNDKETRLALDELNFSHYNEQFYWILDNNRVVIETEGIHSDLRIQGHSTEVNWTQKADAAQRLWGVQSVWALPTVVSGLLGKEKGEEASVTAVAVEITNAEDIQVGGITIDTGFDLSDPSIIDFDDLAKGDTYAQAGGGSLFDNLDADNTPNFLQGFPTVNLQPLIDGGTKLSVGEVVPEENLNKAGIVWGNLLTREGFEFRSNFSSVPGIKRLRPNRGSNEDLVKILSNPFLTPEERDFHYLNSLIWFNLGQTIPELEVLDSSVENQNWYRFVSSLSHNRTLIQYEAEKIEAKYSNVFANPGVSLTLTPLLNEVNISQTLNASAGMALGSLFKLVDANNINQSLLSAKEKSKKLKPLARLSTQATSEQRRAINLRLNSTLSHANANSSLAQVSGSWTWGKSTPDKSHIFQVRTGLYEREVYFREEETEQESQSPTFFTQLDLSQEDFGPFEFRGEQFPIENTAIEPENKVIATQTIVRLPDGRSLVNQFDTRDRVATTTVPLIENDAFDIAFDIIELSKSQVFSSKISDYVGLLYLPSVEVLMAGSPGDFKYSFSAGGWLNLDPNSAPDLQNNIGSSDSNLTDESLSGAYARLGLNWTFQDISFDSENRVEQIITHVPFLISNGTSAENKLNSNTLLLGYQFQLNNRNFGFSLNPSISYEPRFMNYMESELDKSEIYGNFFGNFYTTNGLTTDLSLSWAERISFQAELSKKIINNPNFGTLSLGGYYSNFDTLNRGLSSLIYTEKLGFSSSYLAPQDKIYLELQIGSTNGKFDTTFQSGFKFDL